MPDFSQSADLSYSRPPMERVCYAQLQPVPSDLSLGALITSSTKVCLRDDLGGDPSSSCSSTSSPSSSSSSSSCSGGRYPPESGLMSASTSSSSSSCLVTSPYLGYPGESQYPCRSACKGGSPHALAPGSPESVYEEELSTIQEVLQPRMIGSKGDDDDSSVMFDLTDLTFLDHFSRDEGSAHSTCSPWHDHTPSSFPMEHSGFYSSSFSQAHQHLHYLPSSSSSSTTSSAYLYNNAVDRTTANTTTNNNNTFLYSRCRPRTSSSPRPAPAALTPTPITAWSLHYYDTPTVIHHEHAPSSFPPTPAPSPHQMRDASVYHSHHHHQQHQLRLLQSHQEHHHAAVTTVTSLDNPLVVAGGGGGGGGGGHHDDNDDDPVYKPYCESRRGAKKNLLWKFLLWVLDHRTDLAQWTDLRKGVFKFVDTASLSKLWGQRKHKNDMTFEKLSRGIRHYYKRGLMERMSNTRLVYKFNWDKVPKKYRKA